MNRGLRCNTYSSSDTGFKQNFLRADLLRKGFLDDPVEQLYLQNGSSKSCIVFNILVVRLGRGTLYSPFLFPWEVEY